MKFTDILYDALYVAMNVESMMIDQQQLQFEYDNDNDTNEMVDQVLEIYDDLRNEVTDGMLTITLSDGKIVELDSDIYDDFIKYEEENPKDNKDIKAVYLQNEDGLFQELMAILVRIDNIRDVLFFIDEREKISQESDISTDLNQEITNLQQAAKELIIETMATDPVDPFVQMIIHNNFENEYGEQPLLDFIEDLGLLGYLRLKYKYVEWRYKFNEKTTWRYSS